jgi:hypothetical protein
MSDPAGSGSYIFNPAVDVDMTTATANARRNVPGNWLAMRRYREIAVEKINVVIRSYRPRTAFVWDDFHVTLEATSIMTGKKNTPVEWMARKEGQAFTQAGRWVAIINQDDPPADRPTVGPRQPHIGYDVVFVRDGDCRLLYPTIGHILIPNGIMDACRPPMRQRAYFEAWTDNHLGQQDRSVR